MAPSAIKRVTNSTIPRADEDDRARLSYSFDGSAFVDTGSEVRLRFGKWKGARMAVYCFGPNGGWIDVDYLRFTHGMDRCESAGTVGGALRPDRSRGKPAPTFATIDRSDIPIDLSPP